MIDIVIIMMENINMLTEVNDLTIINTEMRMRSPRLSLEDLAGREYLDAVCRAASFIFGSSYGELRDASVRKVDFYPRGLQERLDALLQ